MSSQQRLTTSTSMAPPAYTPPTANPTTPSPHRRTILDLRAQILANATLLHQRPSDDNIEVVLAKTSTTSSTWDPFNSSSSSKDAGGEKHYALLVKKTYAKNDLAIVIRGEERGSVEEALEWLLERTEGEVHLLAARHGREVGGGECSVM